MVTHVQVDGATNAWKLILRHLYPLCAHVTPTIDELHDMLPLVHKVQCCKPKDDRDLHAANLDGIQSGASLLRQQVSAL